MVRGKTTEATSANGQAPTASPKKSKAFTPPVGPASPGSKRSYLKQADVPNLSLDDALRIPQAIFDHYAGRATAPFHVAKALSVDPKGSQMRLLSGASIAFGLIEGGAQAATISVTELARQIIRPRAEDEDVIAKREAVLRPRVFGDFLKRYDQSPFPRHDIALNVLEELGVPRDKTDEVLERLDASAKSVGFIEQINGKAYVSLSSAAGGDPTTNGVTELTEHPKQEVAEPVIPPTRQPSEIPVFEPQRTPAPSPISLASGASMKAAVEDDLRRRRVFITHGKDRALVDPIRKLLEYGELEPIVSVERQSVSKPVPEKIMDDMRRCGAAIIHVDADKVLTDDQGAEHVLLNPNVLIEIGAAMAFYGRRFILLVREGVKLPSNLQGLYEVRYPGDTMDAAATIKLLEAMKDIKNYALPSDIEPETES
ncbi:TIR domain-containing protein [Rhizorhabdus phycosphaerae]|uniref:TIR domain-containing protein n=1 Tax=Rhizorhabdus phycosphaerae TaxID=2711156 RepID=UPI0013EBFDD9|nr:TIR domain-containing protein [Rhizorhabdus phycosphaerae]